MARKYIDNTVTSYFTWMNLDKDTTPKHIELLIDQYQTYIADLQKSLGQTLEVDFKQFIRNAIDDSFTPLKRYGYVLEYGAAQQDTTTGMEYHQVTVSYEGEAREYTEQDVGTTAFSKEFERVTGIDPSGVPNKKVWALYQRFMELSSTMAATPEVQRDTINAWLIFYSDTQWMFKISNDTIENILQNYKKYLDDLAKKSVEASE